MDKDILPLIGVVIGGIIAVLGNLITVLFQRNQERIKFQKEIYESRFKILEDYLEKYYDDFMPKNILSNLNEGTLFDKIMQKHIDTRLLRYLDITDDDLIIQSVNLLVEKEQFLVDLTFDITENKKSSNLAILMDATDDIVNAYSMLIAKIDKFRLNGYKPVKVKNGNNPILPVEAKK